MRAVIQRVSRAAVSCNTEPVREIAAGLLVLLGIEHEDTVKDIVWLSRKIVQMRIFNDAANLMNLSLKDTGGDIMLISQFTLHAATHKGNRPSFIRAARPEQALPLYMQLADQLSIESGRPVVTGFFGEHMDVSFINDGPVTIIIDSKSEW